MQEVHADFADFVFAVFQHKLLRVRELADGRRFDAFRRTQSFELPPVRFRDGQHHAFLSFGDPDFGVRQSRILQRSLIKPDFGADVFTHFTDGTAEAAGAAVGDGGVQIQIASRQDHIGHHLFGDRIADLHGSRR